MALYVERQILSEVCSRDYFGIMMDETTDIARKEQVSFCFRIISDDLEVKELF